MNTIKNFIFSGIFRTSVILAAILFSSSAYAQDPAILWTKLKAIPEGMKSARVAFRPSNPVSGYRLDRHLLDSILARLQDENSVLLSFPDIYGGNELFTVKRAAVMSAQMEKRFPEILSFRGTGVNHPLHTVRLTTSPSGIHAVLEYDFRRFHLTSLPGNRPECIFSEEIPEEDLITEDSPLDPGHLKSAAVPGDLLPFRSDTLLRKFRLALACTGEFSQEVIDLKGIPPSSINTIKKLAVLAYLNELVGEINAFYQRELSVTFELVPQTFDMIFLNPRTDSLTNKSKDTLINEIPAVMNKYIPLEEYDIGHVLSSTYFGGLAGGSVCSAGKMRGVSCGFSLNTILHEMGHQFGAGHTFNCAQCGDGKPGAFPDPSVSAEPECGRTLMSYGGMEEVRFHSLNIAQIYSRIINAPCGTKTRIPNPPPLAEAGDDYIIPVSTPFVLKGSATDINDTLLTYNWEQIDTEGTQIYDSRSVSGPLSQCLLSSKSPVRYMPDIQTVLSGGLNSFNEITPSVGRVMNYALIVRDNHPGGGQVSIDKMKVTVDGSSGPFRFISQLKPEKWFAGESVSMVWEVAGTNREPVNVAFVNILLSRDGGLTFTDTLKRNTPNDGLELINVPAIQTGKGRIKIEAAGNIFYTVNPAPVSIESSDMRLVLDSNYREICVPDSVRFNFSCFDKTPSGEISFDAQGLPPGAKFRFITTPPVTNGSPVSFIVYDLDESMIGVYPVFILVKKQNVVAHSTGLTLKLHSGKINPVLLTAPENGLDSLDFPVPFKWKEDPNVKKYVLEVAKDADFRNVEILRNILADSTLILNDLAGNTKYFWRIKGENSCGTGPWSDVFKFVTRDSLVYIPDDNFEKILIAYRYDDIPDDSVRFSRINRLEHLRIPEKKIQDLTGIESFINIDRLNCSTNLLELLDVSKNLRLKGLDCSGNRLQRIEIRSLYLTSFNALINTPLTCVLVDDSVYYRQKFAGAIPLTASYRTDCGSDSLPQKVQSFVLKSAYPNPTTGKIHISGYNGSAPVHGSVYTILGKEILKIRIDGNQSEIDLTALTPGFYLLVFDEPAPQVFKIFKH